MATQADLMQALRNADAAGDVEAATRIAQLIKPQRKMPEMSSVPDDYEIEELPELAQQEDPGIFQRLFNPAGGIGEFGPPPLTREESRSALGMLGATAGSVIAPQFTLPTLLARGSGTIFGSGLGGATGEMIADTVTGQRANPAQDALQYSAAETLGHGAGKLIEKAFTPLSKGATAAMDKAVKLFEFAKKNDVPISSGALIPGMTEKVLQGGADNFIPSRLVSHHYRGKLVTRLNELMATIPSRVGQVLPKEQSSLITTEAFRAASNAKQATAKRLRSEFLDSIGHQTPIQATNTISKLKTIQSQAKDKGLRDFVETELAGYTNGAKSAELLETTLNQIGSVKPRGADKKFLTELREAIQSDFKASGADMEKLSNSSNFFKMNSELLTNPVARKMMNEEITSSRMTAQIFQPNNIKFIKQLARELPPDTWDSLRAQNLANQLENFSKDYDKIPGARIVDGENLTKWIQNNKSVLESAYDKETVEAFENFALLAKAAKSDIAEHGKGAIDLTALSLTGSGGGAAKYLQAEPTVMLIGGSGLTLAANEMMRPNGLLKLWLVKGFPKVQKGLNVGKEYLRENAPGFEQSIIGGTQAGIRSINSEDFEE